MIFYPYYPEHSSGSLKRKYLAFILLLAGWLVFCYWLYTKEIYPRLHAEDEMSWLVHDDELEIPLAYTWGSDTPHAGKGFEEWADGLRKLDTAGYYFIVKSTFFRDEKPTVAMGDSLARRRVYKMMDFLGISSENVLLEVVPSEVGSDVRAHPFESLHFTAIEPEELVEASKDTIEICFPLRDSLRVPEKVWANLGQWLMEHNGRRTDTLYVTGTADATGISEAADMAWERALAVQKFIVVQGWSEDIVKIETGQRHMERSIKNRCVILYFN